MFTVTFGFFKGSSLRNNQGQWPAEPRIQTVLKGCGLRCMSWAWHVQHHQKTQSCVFSNLHPTSSGPNVFNRVWHVQTIQKIHAQHPRISNAGKEGPCSVINRVAQHDICIYIYIYIYISIHVLIFIHYVYMKYENRNIWTYIYIYICLFIYLFI